MGKSAGRLAADGVQKVGLIARRVSTLVKLCAITDAQLRIWPMPCHGSSRRACSRQTPNLISRLRSASGLGVRPAAYSARKCAKTRSRYSREKSTRCSGVQHWRRHASGSPGRRTVAVVVFPVRHEKPVHFMVALVSRSAATASPPTGESDNDSGGARIGDPASVTLGKPRARRQDPRSNRACRFPAHGLPMFLLTEHARPRCRHGLARARERHVAHVESGGARTSDAARLPPIVRIEVVARERRSYLRRGR